MKKSLLWIILGLFLNSFVFAQNVEPTFEKQKNLVKATYYFEDGQIREVGYFNADKLHGKWVSYDREGKIKVVATYKNGKKVGKWYLSGENSVKVVTYKSSKIIKVEEVDKLELTMI